MKNLRYTLLISMSILACEANLFNALPPETQEGKGTFGCKIDGEVWTPSVDAAFDQRATVNIEYDTSLAITATGKRMSVSMWVTGEIFEENYILNSPSFPNGRHYNGEKAFITNKNYTGELNITKYDTLNEIISGTFWFDAVNSEGDKVEVREGRFDLIYKSN